MAENVAMVTAGSWVAAQAAAVPMNGAVQGVDSTAVSAPTPSAPTKVSWRGLSA